MAETVPLQRCALGLGLAITTVGIVRVGITPVQAPMPQNLPQQVVQQLKVQGWLQRSNIAAEGRNQVSNTNGVVLRRAASLGLPELTLSLVPVRVRGSQHLSIETIQRDLFRTSALQPRLLRIGADELLRFRSGRAQQAASCIASGEAKANEASLGRAIAAAPAGGWPTRIKKTIGLEPLTNMSCLYSLLSIDTAANTNSNANDSIFKEAWRQVGPVLTQRGK